MSATLSRKGYETYRCGGFPCKYPKSTEEAAMELHGRGFKCSAGRLDTMVRAKDVKPRRGPDGRTFEWN